jgi:hypothetical protein
VDEENRFRFTVEEETYEIELVEVERNEDDEVIAVTFNSTLLVDAVIVYGGPGANVYEFPEGVSERAELEAPTNENSGKPFPIEQVTFCYDPETPNEAENAGGRPFALAGLDAGRALSAVVGLAAAGMVAVRRRR